MEFSRYARIKIEGRNRDPRYVETVARIYKKALENKLTKKEMDKSIEELKRAMELVSNFPT